MNSDLDVKAAYERAALLVAVLAFQNKISVPKGVFQHHDWYSKDCPTILRNEPNGWTNFLDQIKAALDSLTPVPAPALVVDKKNKDHHLVD